MLRNYLIIALRNLNRHKLQSATTIFGLSLSMTVCLLIITLIWDQKSYDTFHEHSNRIYRVYSDFKSDVNRDKHLYAMSPAALAGVLEGEVPEVDYAVRIRRGLDGLFTHEGEGVQVDGLYVDPAFFDMFSFRLVSGDPRTALEAPNTIVLSEETAAKLFGDADPVGQTIIRGEGENAVSFTVTGVVEDPLSRTHFPVDAFASLATVTSDSVYQSNLSNWTENIYSWYTYFVLKEGASAAEVEARLPGIIASHFAPREDNVLHSLHVQSIREINLSTVKDNELTMLLPNFVAYFLSALAAIIMIVACFNYVGLSIARALKRAKEVGVRKVVGARRAHLVGQFLVEALLYAFCALVAGCALMSWLLPAFNSLWFVRMTETTLSPELLLNPQLYLVFFTFTALIAVAAGLYPAFYLSKFKPVAVVKGEAGITKRSRFSVRKGLVVLQFAIALVLAVSITVIYRQAVFMANADYGFDKENVINVNLQDVPYEVFRNEVAGIPGVINVSATSILPGTGSRADVWLRKPGMEEPVKGYRYAVDERFIDNMNLKLLAGRGFAPGTVPDAPQVVLNETALRELELGAAHEAVGQYIEMGDEQNVEIIGVVANYQANSIAMGQSPLALFYQPDWLQWANLRVVPGEAEEVAAQLKSVWEKFGRPVPMEYDLYSVQLSETEDNLVFSDLKYIVGVIAVLALVIACLGLLGMAAYAAEVRTKEIGIRKVLGATVLRVSLLLSKDFLVLILLATALAAPLAWYLNNLWLQAFANRTTFGLSTVILCAAVMLALALLTIASQTVRKARTNPVDSLRYE